MHHNRLFARLIAVLLGLCLLCGTAVTASADTNAVIAFSASSLAVGDTLTVTVTFSGSSVGAVDAALSYDAAILQFISGNDASGGGGVVRLAGYATAEAASLRFVLTFKALKAGSSTVRIDSSTVYSWEEQLLGSPTAGATVSVRDQSLSQNANLQSLSLSAGTLSPAFSAGTTVYHVSVKNYVDAVTISAVAADSGATVKISGSSALAEGANTRTITVTAPGGAVKVYTVTINRQKPTTTGVPTTTTTVATTTAEPEDDPVTLSWQDAVWQVASLKDAALPDGFAAGTAEWQGEEIPAARQEQNPYALLRLLNAETNEETRVLLADDGTLLACLPLETARGTYFVLPPEEATPAGMIAGTRELNGLSCPVWSFEAAELADFAVVRAIAPDGTVGAFRFDTAESTLQRYVTAAPAATSAKAADVTTAAPTTASAPPAPKEAVAAWLPWCAAVGCALVAIAMAILAIIFRRRGAEPKPKPEAPVPKH